MNFAQAKLRLIYKNHTHNSLVNLIEIQVLTHNNLWRSTLLVVSNTSCITPTLRTITHVYSHFLWFFFQKWLGNDKGGRVGNDRLYLGSLAVVKFIIKLQLLNFLIYVLDRLVQVSKLILLLVLLLELLYFWETEVVGNA